MSFKHLRLFTKIIPIVANFVYNYDVIFHLAWIDSKGFSNTDFRLFRKKKPFYRVSVHQKRDSFNKYTKLLQILLRQLSLKSEHFDVCGSNRLKIFLYNKVRKKIDQVIYMFTYFNWRTKNETYKWLFIEFTLYPF